MGAVADQFGLEAGSWENIWLFLEENMPDENGRPTAVGTTEGNHVTGSFHYRGQALDRGAFGEGNNCYKQYELLKPYADHPGAPLVELFFNPAGTGWKFGWPIGSVVNHDNHLHVAIAAGATLPLRGAPAPSEAPRQKMGETSMLFHTTKDEFYLVDLTGNQKWIANGISPNVWMTASAGGVPTHPEIVDPLGVIAFVVEILAGKLGKRQQDLTDAEIRGAIGG